MVILVVREEPLFGEVVQIGQELFVAGVAFGGRRERRKATSRGFVSRSMRESPRPALNRR
jgi:hypothetical protein